MGRFGRLDRLPQNQPKCWRAGTRAAAERPRLSDPQTRAAGAAGAPVRGGDRHIVGGTGSKGSVSSFTNGRGRSSGTYRRVVRKKIRTGRIQRAGRGPAG